MSLEITMIVLLAAIFNASWNAIVKVSCDTIAIMEVITLTPGNRINQSS